MHAVPCQSGDTAQIAGWAIYKILIAWGLMRWEGTDLIDLLIECHTYG